MRFLLDTCVVSEFARPRPAASVTGWLAAQREEDLYLSVLTLGEIQKGIAALADGRRQARLQAWLDDDLQQRFGGRIVGITAQVALLWGRISGEAARRGRPVPVIDALIAASASAIDATVVTRNESDLRNAGARTFNPWAS